MDLLYRHRQSLAPFLATFGVVLSIGCASPGPPRAPSLLLPQPVSDLSAARVGGSVELRFSVPHLTSDKLQLYDPKHHRTTIRGTICREVDHQDCATITSIQPTLTAAVRNPFTWQDELPPMLTSGLPHLLGYRVEFFNAQGRSAGKSEPTYTASGPAPSPVTDLRAKGTRQGVLLEWAKFPKATGEVLLSRVALQPKPTLSPKPATPVKSPARNSRASGSATRHDSRDDETWLAANSSEGRTLDTTGAAGEPYRYTAVRRNMVTLGSRTFDVRSVTSAPIEFTLAESFPPDAPTGLTAAGFQPPAAPGESTHFAVDLIWQPVDNGIAAQIASPVAGYNIYRETLDAQGHATSPPTHLNTTPVPIPGFHDVSAEAGTRYRYSITAVDGKGNESVSASVTLEPTQ